MLRMRFTDMTCDREDHVIESTLCFFRHYDWCWNWSWGTHGFSGGLNICNGGAFELPYGDKPDYNTAVRVTLAAALAEWKHAILGEIRRVLAKGHSETHMMDWESAVRSAFQIAKPAVEKLATHAVDNRSNFVEAVTRPSTRGGCCVGVEARVQGFDPESCWETYSNVTRQDVTQLERLVG